MESKKGGLEQLVQPLKQVQVDDQFTHPSIHQSFVASGRCIEPDAPALWSSGGGNSGIEPFGTGGDTHTHGVFWACLRPWTPTNRPEEVRGRAFWAGRHQQGAGWLSEGHRRPKHEPERVDSDRSD